MSVLDILTLQGLDDEAAAFQAALSDVERRLQGDETLNTARREFAAAEEQVNAAQKEQRRLDGELQGLRARIEPEEKRLYGGSVKNPKELQSIQHEVDLLKQQRSSREDELLEVLGRLEAGDAERAAALRKVEQHEMRRSQEVQALRQEANRLSEAITRVQARRESQKALIAGPALLLYEDLRRRKGGQAVVRVKSSSCSGCRVQLPETVRKRAMSYTQMAQCPNCERILVVA